MDYSKLASLITSSVKEQVNAASPHIRLGVVEEVKATTLLALIDGSSVAATVVKGCACNVGDRVIILRQGTQFYAIARVGG